MRSTERSGGPEEPLAVSPRLSLRGTFSPCHCEERSDEAISAVDGGIDRIKVLIDRREHHRYTITKVP